MIINPISSPSGMKPIIRVTSPIGSSVTCNGETKTVTDTSVDFTVSVSATPYTVTASKDGKTQSKSVTVDAVALFPVTLDYMPSGCIAEYMFNGDTEDTSGSGNHLSNHNVTYGDFPLSGISKYAIFNGTNAYVEASTPILPNNNKLSIAFWINYTSWGNWFNSAYPAPTANERKGYATDAYTGKIRFDLFALNNKTTEFFSSTSVSVGNWYFVCLTQDENTAKIYVNNDSGSVANVTDLPNGNYSNFIWGKVYNRAGTGQTIYSNTNLAALRIYNRPLSASEIATLYNDGQGR